MYRFIILLLCVILFNGDSYSQDDRYLELFKKANSDLYEETIKRDIEIYDMYASFVPELALDVNLRDSLVKNFINNNHPPIIDVLLGIYKQVYLESELDSLVRLKSTEEYIKVAEIDKWLPQKITIYVGNVCKSVASGDTQEDLDANEISEEYLTEFQKVYVYKPGMYDYIIKLHLNADNLTDYNITSSSPRHSSEKKYSKKYNIQNDKTRQKQIIEDYLNRNLSKYVALELYKSGFKMSDFYLIEKIRQHPLIKKDHEVTKLLIKSSVKEYSVIMSQYINPLSNYLKEQGYEIPEPILMQIKKSHENKGKLINDIYSD